MRASQIWFICLGIGTESLCTVVEITLAHHQHEQLCVDFNFSQLLISRIVGLLESWKIRRSILKLSDS